MSMAMDEEIRHWTARRKAAVVVEIIQGKTTVTEVSRQSTRRTQPFASLEPCGSRPGVHSVNR